MATQYSLTQSDSQSVSYLCRYRAARVAKNHFVSSATGFGPGQGEDAKSGGKQVQEWETVWAGHG